MTDSAASASDEGLTPGDRVEVEELLELAALELLGVLDPVDLARLRRGFDLLPPAQQARIVALQESVALDPSLRDTEKPAGSLRQFSIGRVKQAIEADVESPAPLAHIGPPTSRLRGEPMSRERIREIVREVSLIQSPPQPQQLVWRAASFVLLGALCVSLYMNWHQRAISEELADAVSSGGFDREVALLARDLGGFDLPGARHVDLIAATQGLVARAGAYVDAAGGRIAVYGLGFEPDSTVEIVIRAGDGTDDPSGLGDNDGDNDKSGDHVVRSRKLRVTSSGFGVVESLDPALLAGARIEVLDGDGRVLFRQA